MLGANGNHCRITPFNKFCAYAQHLGDNQSGQSDFQKAQIYQFTQSYYLAYLSNRKGFAPTCGALDPLLTKYYPAGNESISLRSLSARGERRRLNADYPFVTLYCFNGWGLNSIQYVYKVSETEPDASICKEFFPAGSAFDLDKLIERSGKAETESK